MNSMDLYSAIGEMDEDILEQSEVEAYKWKGRLLKWGTVAACFGLIFMAAVAFPGSLREQGSVLPPSVPDILEPVPDKDDSQTDAESSRAPAVPEPIVNWENVVVNEAEQLVADAARYYDPAIYEEELWGEEEIADYYGWMLVPGYIPKGLTDGGGAISGKVIRSRESGELVYDQIGRGFFSSFYEDGSPKSDDDIVIPTGFTLMASRLEILHCGILPVKETKVTNFGGVHVTLIHCSMPHGPFDPDSYAPNGLYHTPAGYYDIYQASFEMDGVQYEITAQRLELEEVIRIVASVINVAGEEDFVVGEGVLE